MTLKVIVFDFDGTLADTYDAFIEIANSLSGEFGYKPVDIKEQETLKNLSAKALIKQSEISVFKIPFVLKRVKSELSHKIRELEPIKDIPHCLKELKNQGYSLGIITSNTEENVMKFLTHHNLENFFDFIYGESTLFGKHRIIKKLLKEKQLLPDEVIYIGDETRDIYSAKKSRVQSVAVTWGFNSSQALAEQEPDFLINKPYELVTILQNYQYDVISDKTHFNSVTIQT
ncbi:HAD-IIIC family phosphatase [Crocosphaera sp. Alani8]|uniref:HAD-IIIC family phosphatase n=1 Tax=Crocosphaera sp. Alani8 TaxID=3038952 RepID=UPI00313DBC3E